MADKSKLLAAADEVDCGWIPADADCVQREPHEFRAIDIAKLRALRDAIIEEYSKE